MRNDKHYREDEPEIIPKRRVDSDREDFEHLSRVISHKNKCPNLDHRFAYLLGMGSLGPKLKKKWNLRMRDFEWWSFSHSFRYNVLRG